METAPDKPGLNDAFFEQLSDPETEQRARRAAMSYTLYKMRYIQHVPIRYYLPDMEPAGCLKRLYEELADKGEIEMHPKAWIPKCLIDEGFKTLPEK